MRVMSVLQMANDWPFCVGMVIEDAVFREKFQFCREEQLAPETPAISSRSEHAIHLDGNPVIGVLALIGASASPACLPSFADQIQSPGLGSCGAG